MIVLVKLERHFSRESNFVENFT